MSPVYANGNLFLTSTLYSVQVATYYNPLSLALLHELVMPTDQRGGSVVAAVDLPARFSGRSYGELVRELRVEHDAVALGLYRFGVPVRDGLGVPVQFTLLAPPQATVLFSSRDGCDRVFYAARAPVEFGAAVAAAAPAAAS